MKKTYKETSDKLNKLSNHIQLSESDKSNNEKKQKKKKPSFRTSEVIVLIFLTSFISLAVGGALTYNLTSTSSKYSRADEELQTFLKTYEEVKSNYYKDVDKEKLIEGAIDGMLSTLDGYSTYYNEDESNKFNIRLDGEYNGLGIEVYNNEDGDITIAGVIDDSPASEAGLETDDILIKYNDEDIKGMNINEFVKKVKEDKQNSFELTYIRDGEEKTSKLTKNNIVLKSVASKSFDDNKIGYIYVNVFANNTQKQFEDALKKLEDNGMETLIIDLRGNSGGHLSTAEKMASMFVDKSHPIYQIKSKTKTKKYYSKGKENKDYNIIVLVNGQSASASEVLASALKEQAGAILIGKKTYGKGTVQEMQSLSNGSQFKLTTKEWLTSEGKEVNGKGLEVDVEIDLDEKYLKEPTDENDSQLQKAIEEAKKLEEK